MCRFVIFPLTVLLLFLRDTDSSNSSQLGPLTQKEVALKHDIEALKKEIATLKGHGSKNQPKKKAHKKKKFPSTTSSDSDGDNNANVLIKKKNAAVKAKGNGKGRDATDGVYHNKAQ